MFQALLVTHVIAGSPALATGAAAMIMRKGGRNHVRWGGVFFGSMMIVGATAVAMSLMRSGSFLLMVGIFSTYMTWTGWRAPRLRATTGIPAADVVIAIAAAVAAIAFITFGFRGNHPLALVAVAFGGILLIMSGSDLVRYVRRGEEKMAWWFRHMTRMLGAYIATVTAFAVVNLEFLPQLVVWLTPTVIGTIGITIWVAYYRVRFATANRPQYPS